MPSFISRSVALSSVALLTRLSAAQVFSFCTDPVCDTCPVAPGQAVGYPLCNIYDTKTVLGDNDFPTLEGGGWQAYVDIPQPGEGCTVIIRSPAYATDQNCGVPVGLFKNAGCAAVPLRDTFLLQFCCGSGDCTAAGANGKKMIRGMDRRGGGSSGYMFTHANGTEIEPIYSGESLYKEPEEKSKRSEIAAPAAEIAAPIAEVVAREPQIVSTVPTPTPLPLAKRSCSGWTNIGDVYTKNADGFTIVANNVNGGTAGGSITVTVERSTSVTSSFELGIADIVSLGVSVAVEETTSNSEAVLVNIAPGAVGILTWTALLNCQKGTSTCDGVAKDGEVCGGFKRGNDVAGTYSVASGTKKN